MKKETQNSDHVYIYEETKLLSNDLSTEVFPQCLTVKSIMPIPDIYTNVIACA